MNVSGDLLWHNSLWASAELDAKKGRFDFRPQLGSVKKYVASADLAICHSEVPFAKKGGPYKNYPLFAAPQAIAPALRATGWDLCTTASNHTMDQGWDGLVRTIEVHHDAGILQLVPQAFGLASRHHDFVAIFAGIAGTAGNHRNLFQ